MRLKILVIPHHAAAHQRSRAIDLARYWARRHEVCVVRVPVQPPGLSVLGKLRFHLAAMRTRCRREEDMVRVTLPALFRVRWLHAAWVRRAVQRLFRARQFDCVVNFSYWGQAAGPGALGFEVPSGSFRYVYDLTDDHTAGYRLYGDEPTAAAVDGYVRRQVERASVVVVTSQGHRELVRRRWGREAVVIPNGYYDPSSFGEAPALARDLRRQWGWQGRTVLGYVGSLDGWVNLEFLADVFQEYRKGDPEACLLVVGGGPRLEILRAVFGADPHVRLAGWVPSAEVERYLALLDVGLIPFDVNPLTIDVLPIKTLEYLVWGKPVVATPLDELKRIAFQNVFLADPHAKEWAALIGEIRAGERAVAPPERVRDATREYSWERLAERYESLLT